MDSCLAGSIRNLSQEDLNPNPTAGMVCLEDYNTLVKGDELRTVFRKNPQATASDVGPTWDTEPGFTGRLYSWPKL